MDWEMRGCTKAAKQLGVGGGCYSGAATISGSTLWVSGIERESSSSSGSSCDINVYVLMCLHRHTLKRTYTCTSTYMHICIHTYI